MKELGQYLKSEREKQGLTLDDLESRTKIHIRKLQDIEEGNKDNLPAKVFCIGLIKSYARELRADMNKIDELCQTAFVSADDPPIESKPAEPTKSTEPAAENDSQKVGVFNIPKAVLIGAGGILSLVLLFVIIQLVEKMNSYEQEEALPEEVFVSQEADTESDSEKLEAEELQAIDEEIEPLAEKPKPKKEMASKVKEETQKVVKSEPKPDPIKKTLEAEESEPVVVETVAEEDFSEDNFGGPTEDKKRQSAPVVVSDNKLTLTALEPVRAEVVWSDGYVQVMLLKSNESKTLVFSQPITLRVNNGGAVQVSFNESEKKVPGPFNQPIEIKYP